MNGTLRFLSYLGVFAVIISLSAYLTLNTPAPSADQFATALSYVWVVPLALLLLVVGPLAAWYASDKIKEYKCGKKGHFPVPAKRWVYEKCPTCGNPFAGHHEEVIPNAYTCQRCGKYLEFKGAEMVKVVQK